MMKLCHTWGLLVVGVSSSADPPLEKMVGEEDPDDFEEEKNKDEDYANMESQEDNGNVMVKSMTMMITPLLIF